MLGLLAKKSHRKTYPEELKNFSAINVLRKTIFSPNSTISENEVVIKNNLPRAQIKISSERFSFMIYSLLRDFLRFSGNCKPNITIEIKKITYKKCSYTAIIFCNEISKSNDKNIFNIFSLFQEKVDFRTNRSFCEKSMKMFGGKVIYEAESRRQMASLLFPMTYPKCHDPKNKRVLIVDDAMVNLIIAKSKIERNLKNVECIIENNPKSALSLLSKDQARFDLILSDFEMPEVNGYKLSKQIRQKGIGIPIIIYSSRKQREFGELDFRNAPFSQYLRKDAKTHILCRSVAKWLNIQDSIEYFENNHISHILINKRILLVDNNDLDRKITKERIEKFGAAIIEAKTGKDLIEIYKKNLRTEPLDLIVTSITIPGIKGDVATKTIRQIEIDNKIHHSSRIPIIALLNNNQLSNIKEYLECKITDYCLKENNPKYLAKLIATHLDRF